LHGDTYALRTVYFIFTFDFVIHTLFKNTKIRDRVPFRYHVSVPLRKQVAQNTISWARMLSSFSCHAQTTCCKTDSREEGETISET